MRENIKKILFIIIIVIFCYGVLANINHVISVNKKYSYNFDNSVEILGIKESHSLLKEYIDNLKKLTDSTLEDDIITAYTENLEKISNSISNFAFMNYKGDTKLKQSDLYQMMDDYSKINYVNMLNMYKKLGEKYSTISSKEKQFTEHVYNMILSSNYVYETLADNYTYSSFPKHDSDFTVMTILSLFQEKLNTLNYVNSLVISTGTVSEEVEQNPENNPQDMIESGENNE